MDNETAGKTRGMIRRVIIKKTNDQGATQTVSAQVADNIWHDDVEILQPFGFATSTPEDGAVGIALSVGADEGDMVVLPVSNPSSRFGDLSQGDSVLYTSGGDYIKLGADGTLEITVADTATLNIPGGMVIKTPKLEIEGDVHIKGDLKIDGRMDADNGIKAKGDVEDHTGTMQKMRDQHNAHGHPNAPSPPIQKMD